VDYYEAAVADLASPETWCQGARALARIGDPRAITPLVGAFNRAVEADKSCLLDALRALGAGERADQLATSENLRQRAIAVRLMELFPDPGRLGPLTTIALHDPDADLRRAAARTLSLQKRTPTWEAATIRMLAADDSAVRGEAIESLALQDSRATERVLLDHLEQETDPSLVKKLRAFLASRLFQRHLNTNGIFVKQICPPDSRAYLHPPWSSSPAAPMLGTWSTRG